MVVPSGAPAASTARAPRPPDAGTALRRPGRRVTDVHPADGGDGRQGLAPEAQGTDLSQVLLRPQLGGGVAQEGGGQSSGAMPQPSSVTRIRPMPPRRISTTTAELPASMAFSTSSLTTLAGRSTTSPASGRRGGALLLGVVWCGWLSCPPPAPGRGARRAAPAPPPPPPHGGGAPPPPPPGGGAAHPVFPRSLDVHHHVAGGLTQDSTGQQWTLRMLAGEWPVSRVRPSSTRQGSEQRFPARQNPSKRYPGWQNHIRPRATRTPGHPSCSRSPGSPAPAPAPSCHRQRITAMVAASVSTSPSVRRHSPDTMIVPDIVFLLFKAPVKAAAPRSWEWSEWSPGWSGR